MELNRPTKTQIEEIVKILNYRDHRDADNRYRIQKIVFQGVQVNAN